MIKRETMNGMGALLRAAWESDRCAFVRILLLNILSSMLGGIGIVMLIPLLNLLSIGADGVDGAFQRILAPISGWAYAVQVTFILAVYVALVAVKAVVNRFVSIRETEFMEDTGYRLRGQLYDAMSGMEWERFASQKQTDLMNLFLNQCGRVCSGYGSMIGLITSLFSALIQLGIALAMSLPLTVMVCLLGGAMMMVFKPLRRKSREFGDETIRINSAFFSELTNQMNSVKEARAYGVEGRQAEKFDDISRGFKDMHLRYQRLFTIPQVVYAIASALLIAAVYMVSTLVLNVAVDRLVVLVYIFARLWPLFSGLQGDIQYIHGCLPAYEKLSQAMADMKGAQERGEEEDSEDFSLWQSVALRDVTFTYHDGDAPVLTNVNLALECGSVTALLGRNGTGKTTMANLLLGLLKPDDGSIEIDGRALTRRNLRAWRRQVGYVPQDPILLNASVRENLICFHPDAGEHELIDALRRAQAWDVVEALPDGMDTLVGEKGIRLSGGERQRIVLARVLIGNPRLVILDEATSAMDYESERVFQQMISSMRVDAAVLVIAHRLSTIRMASRVLVLENGGIAEEGSIDDLLNRPGGHLAGMIHVD